MQRATHLRERMPARARAGGGASRGLSGKIGMIIDRAPTSLTRPIFHPATLSAIAAR